MLEGIIKTKNILPNIILMFIVTCSIGYFESIPYYQILCIIGVCSLVLFYTKVSRIVKSFFIVNVLFLSFLVLIDFKNIHYIAVLANFLVLLAFLSGRYLYKINKQYVFVKVTLFIFLATLVYPPAVFFILFIYTLLLFHSIKRFSTWILPIFCWIMYTGFTFGISFLIDFDFLTFIKNQLSHFRIVHYNYSPQHLFLLSSLILFTVFALFDHYRMMPKQSLRNKKDYELIFYLLIIAALVFFISKNAILFILFPCSVMIGKYMYYQKNKWIKGFMLLYFPVSAIIWYFL